MSAADVSRDLAARLRDGAPLTIAERLALASMLDSLASATRVAAGEPDNDPYLAGVLGNLLGYHGRILDELGGDR